MMPHACALKRVVHAKIMLDVNLNSEGRIYTHEKSHH